MKFDSSSSLERSALGLGLISGLCLAVAAFAAFGARSDAGWSHVDDLATRARANVREAWEDLRRVDGPGESKDSDAGPRLQAASAEFQLDGPELEPPPQPVRAQPINPPNLFTVLMAQSEICELQQQDLVQALSLAAEAVTKQVPPGHIAQARLRAIQLAQHLGRSEEVREQWQAARAQMDPALAEGDTSTLLLCALAALPALPEAERAAALDPVVKLWTTNALVLPHGRRGFDSEGPAPNLRFAWSPDPHEAALRLRLRELVEFSDDWNGRFAQFDAAAQRADFIDSFGAIASPPLSREAWTLLPAAREWLALRLDDQGRRVGELVSRASTEAALRATLAARHALPEGFAIDLGGENTDLGEMVGPWIDLCPALPRVTLRHPDLASVLREVEVRTRWLRIGMLTLALFVAGAAVATFLALRRQRRLAEARTNFIANVSHELRTPLASILLMSENLESGRAGERAALYPKLLRREALRLRRLIDDVLDFSRLERGKRFELRIEDVDLPAWYEALCADAGASAVQARIELTCTSTDLPRRAAFDAEALRRAALNLIDNALRHSGSREIELAAAQDGQHAWRLSVRDHGGGIPPALRASIFEPFVRLNGSSAAGGAGLGLAIVREIAEAHGGTVCVREAEDLPGSVFELSIPLRESTSVDSEASA